MSQTLDSTTLDEFRRILERKRSELIQSWLRPDEIVAERFADAMDDMVSVANRDLVTDQIKRYTMELSDIDDALVRIADGTFGSCLDCGDLIFPKRLAVLPWAVHCLYCQRLLDQAGSFEERAEGSGDAA